MDLILRSPLEAGVSKDGRAGTIPLVAVLRDARKGALLRTRPDVEWYESRKRS